MTVHGFVRHQRGDRMYVVHMNSNLFVILMMRGKDVFTA